MTAALCGLAAGFLIFDAVVDLAKRPPIGLWLTHLAVAAALISLAAKAYGTAP